jgi:hypothetical protein
MKYDMNYPKVIMKLVRTKSSIAGSLLFIFVALAVSRPEYVFADNVCQSSNNVTPSSCISNVATNNSSVSTDSTNTQTAQSGSGGTSETSGTTTSSPSPTNNNLDNYPVSSSTPSTTTQPVTNDNSNNSSSSLVSPSSSSNTPGDTSNSANTATINNNDALNSQSGNATVTQNNVGGDATSGSSEGELNLINQINNTSSSNQPLTFTYTVNGNVNGNITINPVSLAEQNGSSSSGSSVTDTSSTNNASINNTATVSADSGNASVTSNGVGGDATSGTAEALANLINVIGTVTVNGNVVGNILIPQQLVDSLLNNSPPTNQGESKPSLVTLNNNFTINNQVALLAQSGQALVTNNGVGGNASSGNATTDLTIYNLTGSQVIASNALLVIVNVAGTWTGFILNSSDNSNIALLDGGNSSSVCLPSNSNVTSNNTETINNYITLSADSGNAIVSGNGVGGNATSGDALAEANIVNFLGDQFDLSGWFGILFINVLGNWYGSLGLYNDSAAPLTSNAVSVLSSTESKNITLPALVIFNPAATSGQGQQSSNQYCIALNTTSGDPSNSGLIGAGNSVALASYLNNTSTQTHPMSVAKDPLQHSINWWLVIGGLGGAAVLLGIDRAIIRRQKSQKR